MVIKELFARLGLDFDGAGFAAGEKAILSLSTGLKIAGAAAVAMASAVAGAVGATASRAAQIDDLNKRTGVATDTLQQMDFIAGQSGTSLESVAVGLKFIALNAANAADGSDETAKAFRSLGISVFDSNGNLRRADELMIEASDAFKNLENDTKRTQLATKLFGKSGGDLIPMLIEGSASLRAMAARARELGFVMGEETIKAGADLDDSLHALTTSFKGLTYTIGAPFLKTAGRFVNWCIDASVAVRKRLAPALEWVGKNAKLVAIILGGVVLAALMANIGAIATAVGWYGALAVASTVAALKAAGAWVIAAAPFFLLAAAVVAVLLILEDLWVAFNGGESFIVKIGNRWSEFLDSWLNNNDGDGWLMTALKSLIRGFTDLGGVWDFWKAKAGEVIDWVVLKVQRLAEIVKTVVAPIEKAAQWLSGKVSGATEGLSSGVRGFGEWLGNATGQNTSSALAGGPLFAGGAASPAAAAAMSMASGPRTQSSNFAATINVTPPPTANSEEVAELTRSKFIEFYNNEKSNARAALDQ